MLLKTRSITVIDDVDYRINHRPESNGAVISVCAVSMGLEAESACSVVCRFFPKPTAAMKTIRVRMKVKTPFFTFFIGITILGYKDSARTIMGV